MTGKHIPNGTTSNAEECAPGKSIKEPSHNHCLDILGDGTGDEPYQKKEKRADIDISPAIELKRLADHTGRTDVKQTSDKGARKSGPTPTITVSEESSLHTQWSDIPRPNMKKDRPNVATSWEQ